MADYSLVQRLVVTIDETSGAAGVGPETVAIPTTIKPSSTKLSVTQRETRCSTRVIHINRLFGDADMFPIVASLPGSVTVEPSCSHVVSSNHSNRAAPNNGCNVELSGGGLIRYNTENLGAGEHLEVSTEVIEHLTKTGATVRIVDGDNLEINWQGTIIAGESIVLSIEIFDIENLGDDLKEILFRCRRVLSYLGENLLQDLIIYDRPGNMISYRLRGFDSKTNLDAATKDLVDTNPLETGEDFRVTVTQDIRVDKNDRVLLTKQQTKLLTPTPGVN